jgi:arylsulfatase A-like enzyme
MVPGSPASPNEVAVMNMLRLPACAAILGIVLFDLGSGNRTPAAEPERLNLIAIVTDDQGRWGVGAYDNKEIRTPNMDRLAREGARFVNAFTATPVCSPSRATFMTGRYGTELGITDWISPAEADAGLGLPPEATTWPEVLQKHGYATALIGKWHLGTQPQFHPTRHGFTHFFGFLGGGNKPMDPILEVDGKPKELKGPLPDLLVDDALSFIKTNQSRPFAVSLHFRAPHLPYGPVPEADSAPFRDLDPTVPKLPGLDISQVKRWTRDYYASIHSIDRNLGRLLQSLDELNLSKKTIVLFTSDHGYNIGHHHLSTKGNSPWIAGGVTGPKRPNMFETSIRVPLLVRWPGVVKPDTDIVEPVSNLDTFASVLGMLGIPIPEKVKQHGLDFSPLLRGQKVPWRDAIYTQYDLHNGGLAFMRMIRTEDWKLVRHHLCNGMDELYNLKDDSEETRNLYGVAAHRKVREQLQERLTGWQRKIDDPVLRLPVRMEEKP